MEGTYCSGRRCGLGLGPCHVIGSLCWDFSLQTKLFLEVAGSCVWTSRKNLVSLKLPPICVYPSRLENGLTTIFLIIICFRFQLFVRAETYKCSLKKRGVYYVDLHGMGNKGKIAGTEPALHNIFSPLPLRHPVLSFSLPPPAPWLHSGSLCFLLSAAELSLLTKCFGLSSFSFTHGLGLLWAELQLLVSFQPSASISNWFSNTNVHLRRVRSS